MQHQGEKNETAPALALCRALTLAALLSLLLPASGTFSAAEAPSMRIVYNALGGSMAPLWVGQELGLFAKHGLQHSLNYLAATTSVQAIVAGSEDIGMVGNQCIDVALEGADTIYVASTVNRFIFHLYGDPAIKIVQRSERQNSSRPPKPPPPPITPPAWSCAVTVWYPDKDVKILYAGSMPALVTTLKSGNAAAGLMSAPTTFQAQELGMKPILNVTELNIPFIFVGVCHDAQNDPAKTRLNHPVSPRLYRIIWRSFAATKKRRSKPWANS